MANGMTHKGVNLGRAFSFGQLGTARKLLADEIPGDVPARICRNGGMDEGVPIAVIIRALQCGSKVTPDDRASKVLELYAEARNDHGDAGVIALPPPGDEPGFRAAMRALAL